MEKQYFKERPLDEDGETRTNEDEKGRGGKEEEEERRGSSDKDILKQDLWLASV